MKKVLGTLVLISLFVSTMAFAGKEIWTCDCTAECDDKDITVTEQVCDSEEAVDKAVADGANKCAKELEKKCKHHAACVCECHPTDKPC